MPSFEELVATQKEIGDRISTIIRNFKKDSSARYSVSYFQERLRKLDTEWANFERNDNSIRLMEDPPLHHDYFIEDYYSAITNLVQEYTNIFEAAITKANQSADKPSMEKGAVANPEKHPSADKISMEKGTVVNPEKHPSAIQTNSNPRVLRQSQAEVQTSELSVRLFRRQKAVIESLERLLQTQGVEEPTAKSLWKTIEELHFTILEEHENPSDQGYDLNRFLEMETRMNNSRAASTQHNVNQINKEVIPMPKITLHNFDGNMLKWQEFHDLFVSLVVDQPIPKVQKMWYLKTHVVGEAAILIKHLSATGDNFDAAWELIIDRYNNKRVLVNKLIQELVDVPHNTSKDNYKSLHDKTQECLLALHNLEINTSTWDPLLLHILLKSLDHATRLRYEQSLSKPREVPSIKEFLHFLKNHFQSMEAISKEKPVQNKAKVYTSAVLNKLEVCSLCKEGEHSLFRCGKFLNSSVSSRLQWVKEHKYCFNCLSAGHGAKDCRSRSCTKCSKRHNTLLHLENPTPTTKVPSIHAHQANQFTTKNKAPIKQEATSLTTAKQCKSANFVLLSTAMVNIKTNGKEIQCRAILDSGSQLNFVTERLVKRLGITTKLASISINGIGSNNTKVNRRVNITLHSTVSNFSTFLEAAVLPNIVPPQPSQTINIQEWPIPKTIKLADPAFHRPDKIDILLGAEFYHQLLSIGQIKLAENLPILQNTVLGWIVAGKVNGDQLTGATCGMCTEDDSLDEAIAQLWQLDNVATTNKALSTSEKQCENHFAQTHTIDESGRFVVKIPFCDDPGNLGHSHGVAFNRFLALERRLEKSPEIKTQYIKFMDEYEALGHMTQIDVNSLEKPRYFIPHHCVLRPESLTTKLRVVFDASAKTTSNLSLNDIMHTGPTVQSELFSILLRFRLPRFVFTTDVEKMYRQMLIHPEDRRFQLIMWRKDTSTPIRYYELNTVTYGTRAAPYLATKCLETIAKKNMVRHPLGANFLLNNFYVDDGLGGADSLTEALTIQQELQTLLKQHGLHLQKWSANHPQLLQNISGKEERQEVDIDLTNETVKTLGLTWIPERDQFCIKVCLGDAQKITKRTVISDVARLFDPLGMVAPVVITAKMFIQELWQQKLAWDEALPTELYTRWMLFRKDLEDINNMKFKRHVFDGNIASKLEIHTFSDASEKAYGAAVYIRGTIKNGQVIVQLLCAKSRVAPLKRQSIPRLELCAALLGAELTSRVVKDLNLDNTQTHFWTDSEIVLAWINSQSSSYHTFVANRIAAIHEVSMAEQWRHVGSRDNPADLVSRGLSPKRLSSANLWFYGPLFLHGREDGWPTRAANKIDDIQMELKATSAVTITGDTTTSIIYNINHKGSFKTLQRVVGYIIRFSNSARKIKGSSELALTVKELEDALMVIIQAIQAAEFKEELQQLRRSQEVAKTSKYFSLSPFLDSNGVMRVGGRLEASELSYDTKHPMLIPYNDPITTLITQMIHKENRHCGPGALLSHVRQRFWPIKGSTLTRSVVKNCVQCTKAKPRLFNQIMGNLPAHRVQPARPFINSGVDFCGPFWVHYKVRGKKPQKAYLAIFCCFATKAVHLELVSDLTTEAFLGSVRRFISRRGHCRNLYCDNATNFVGASNQLKELAEVIHSTTAKGTIFTECASKGITFHFIPPRAPHFGGLWEAAVKSAKHLLVRSASTASLTYEELDTVIIEIEGILNSRPLSPMSEDPNDLAALTPGHFLIGEPLNAQVDAAARTTRMGLLKRWNLVAHLKNEFWQRWSKEYLCELQYRHKWKTQRDNAKVGDMVIIKEDNTPPLQWPLGRIEKVYYGDDNMVRVADIKTATGKCRRPIARLAPLPINVAKTDETTAENHSGEENPNQEDQPPQKKKRTSVNHTLLTIIMAIMLLPLVLGAQVQNKKFGKHLGIHFENIGTMAVSSTEWQLLIHYDLKEFWAELSLVKNGTKALQGLCHDLDEKSTCTGVINYFKHAERDLIMSSALLSGKRQKRAALDLVGNIAHSLFGVLDSKYAEEMATTISQVQDNEDHLIKLLRNQTSVIDSTLNIFKTDQQAVKEKFNQMDLQIASIYNGLQGNAEELQQDRIYRMFSSLSLQLIIMASNLQQTQSLLFDILTNTHHGIISPLLLTPSQLQQEVEKIAFHLPDSIELPVSQRDALQLYKLMKIEGGLSENTVIFRVTLPLIQRNKFDLFHLIEIPNWINDTCVSIKSCSPFLAMNNMSKKYYVVSEEDLNSCTRLKEETYLCSETQIEHDIDSTLCSCEMSLLHNKTRTSCSLKQLQDTVTWIPLWHQNQWMYTVPSPSNATAVCQKEVTQITLEGAGLLTLNPECILKHESASLQARQILQSEIKTSYTSLWNTTEYAHFKQLEGLLNNTRTVNYTTEIDKLNALHKALSTHEILQLPHKIKAHNHHHIAVGYTTLTITGIIVLFLIIRRRTTYKYHPEIVPTPAPRQQQLTDEPTVPVKTHTEFTVHI